MYRVDVATVLLLSCCSLSFGATATFNVQLTPNTVQVQAWVNPVDDDVAGISGFAFEVLGLPASSVSWNPSGISVYDPDKVKVMGFTRPFRTGSTPPLSGIPAGPAAWRAT